MTFRFYFPVLRHTVRRKGGGGGRPRGAEFNRIVRRPFHQRVMAQAARPGVGKYNALDREKLRQDSLRTFRQFNAAHTPAGALKKEVGGELAGRKQSAFLPKW